MSDRTKGIIYTILSALIYGFTPILARMAFDGGANGITASFIRGIASLPLLWIVLRCRKIPISPGKDLLPLLCVGVFGTALTTILLYMSYGYISVGLATTIHFTYPILVTLGCVILFGEKLNLSKKIALILCTVGILTFMDSPGKAGVTGIFLSLFSGVTYAFYMIYIEKSELKNMHYLKLTFYLNLIMSVMAGVFGGYSGMLNLSLSLSAWLLCICVSLFTSFGALPLLQQGIKKTGASTAAILSTLEPITSVILGMLILSESMSLFKLGGCVLILVSVLLIARPQSQ